MMPPMLQRFIDEYSNIVVNLDGAADSAGQSVQLAAAWCRFLGLPYKWGDPSDWWDIDDDSFDSHWTTTTRDNSSTIRPMPGAVIVFSPLLPGFEKKGHLSIFISDNDGSEWTGFDSGWNGDVAHLQSHNWAYVLGWFYPRRQEVLEASVPTPLGTNISIRAYDIEEIEPTTITFKDPQQDIPVYNLADMSWNSFSSPATHLPASTKISVSAIARHCLGGTYLMADPTRPEGIDTRDVNTEIGPFKEAVPHRQTMTAPVQAPNAQDTIRIPKEIPTYKSARDAFDLNDPISHVYPRPDPYYVYKRLPNGVLNITKVLGQYGVWINPRDLEEKDWHVLELFPDGPRYFRALSETPVIDLDGKLPTLKILARQPILIDGTFTGPDGRVYGAPAPCVERGQWYGLDAEYMEPIRVQEPKSVREDPGDISKPITYPKYTQRWIGNAIKLLKQKGLI